MSKTLQTRIQLKHDSKASFDAATTTAVKLGEMLVCTDEVRLRVGTAASGQTFATAPYVQSYTNQITKLEGYTIASASSALATTDTLNEALGKLEYRIGQLDSGTVTDVQINSSSITNTGVANIAADGTYNASTNKLATMYSLGQLATTQMFVNGQAFVEGTGADAGKYYAVVSATDIAYTNAGDQTVTTVGGGLDSLFTKIADLTGAMHFIGVLTHTGTNTFAEDLAAYKQAHPEYTEAAGDVFVWQTKEYVYTGSSWEEFGSVNPDTTVTSIVGVANNNLTITPNTNAVTGDVTVTIGVASGYQIPTTTQLSKLDALDLVSSTNASAGKVDISLTGASSAVLGTVTLQGTTVSNQAVDEGSATSKTDITFTQASDVITAHVDKINENVLYQLDTIILDCGTATTVL